jgi:hypothetical protein
MTRMRIIPRTPTDQILVAILEELEGLRDDVEKLVAAQPTPQPKATAAPTPAPKPAPKPVPKKAKKA